MGQPGSHADLAGGGARASCGDRRAAARRRGARSRTTRRLRRRRFGRARMRASPSVVLAEAGTGLGKTAGYLAPATLWAERNDGTVWISTYTKNLQRQIAQELARVYPDEAERAEKVTVRKGRENYVCLLNFEEAAARLPVLVERETVALGLVARWLTATKNGDLQGGDFPAWAWPHPGFAGALTDRHGECIYAACPHYRRCFLERVVRKTRSSRVVVANHALTMVEAARNAALARRSIPTSAACRRCAMCSTRGITSSMRPTVSSPSTSRAGKARSCGAGCAAPRDAARRRGRGLVERLTPVFESEPQRTRSRARGCAAGAWRCPATAGSSRVANEAPRGAMEKFLARGADAGAGAGGRYVRRPMGSSARWRRRRTRCSRRRASCAGAEGAGRAAERDRAGVAPVAARGQRRAVVAASSARGGGAARHRAAGEACAAELDHGAAARSAMRRRPAMSIGSASSASTGTTPISASIATRSIRRCRSRPRCWSRRTARSSPRRRCATGRRRARRAVDGWRSAEIRTGAGIWSTPPVRASFASPFDYGAADAGARRARSQSRCRADGGRLSRSVRGGGRRRARALHVDPLAEAHLSRDRRAAERAWVAALCAACRRARHRLARRSLPRG